jgi:TMEM175 potassium channel family protein
VVPHHPGNLHLLFWLSLVPFATSWMRASEFAPVPVAVYGGVLLLSALAWWLLQTAIIAHQGQESPVREAVGADWKAKGSALLYVTAIDIDVVRTLAWRGMA